MQFALLGKTSFIFGVVLFLHRADNSTQHIFNLYKFKFLDRAHNTFYTNRESIETKKTYYQTVFQKFKSAFV